MRENLVIAIFASLLTAAFVFVASGYIGLVEEEGRSFVYGIFALVFMCVVMVWAFKSEKRKTCQNSVSNTTFRNFEFDVTSNSDCSGALTRMVNRTT